MHLIILPLIFLAEFLTTPKSLLFYDQIEYLRIVTTNGFWQVFSLGHFPIHPFFLSIFWIVTKITIPNYTAYIFGVASGILMYKIGKLIFKDKYSWMIATLFLLFPGIWLINTNLMIQSVLLTFYLLAIYAFLKNKSLLFIISTFLMVGIHVDGVYWIPTIFLIPILFKKELKFSFKMFVRFTKMAFLSIAASLLFYAAMYFFVIKNFGGSTEQIFAYSSFGFLRIIRNIWVCFIYNFGSVTPLVLLYLLIKNVRSKIEWICWIIFALLISIGGAYWEGDLMMRRIVFAGVITSFALYKYLGKKIIYLILFLIPITGFVASTYYKNLPVMPLTDMQARIDLLPKDQVLISSHYYFQFIRYEGTILWFESGDMDRVQGLLEEGKRVFMTKESITAPYLLVIGSNYHITSLNKVGNSEARSLFEKYKVELVGDSFELKLPDSENVSDEAGIPVVFYGNNFSQRLSKMRLNYGDLGIWVWSFITDHKDALGWTYKDVTGAWVWPEISIQ